MNSEGNPGRVTSAPSFQRLVVGGREQDRNRTLRTILQRQQRRTLQSPQAREGSRLESSVADNRTLSTPRHQSSQHRMQADQPEASMNTMMVKYSEDSYRKLVRHQSLAVMPMHGTFASASAQFRHMRDLGRGNYGIVDEVESYGEQYLPDTVYARKEIMLKRLPEVAYSRNDLAQLDAARSLHHVHIVRIILTYEEELGSDMLKYGIIMNPVATLTLMDFLATWGSRPLSANHPSARLQKWTGCLAGALNFLHAKDIAHGRITPGHVMVKGGNVFFTEFAISNQLARVHTIFNEAQRNDIHQIYQAPEVGTQFQYRFKADVFALGTVFIEMANAAAGQTSETFHEYLGKAFDSPFHQHLPRLTEWLIEMQNDTPPGFPPGLVHCIQNMIEHSPFARLSAFEVVSIMLRIREGMPETPDISGNCSCLFPWRGVGED